MAFDAPIKTRVQLKDSELAARQWDEWRATRRQLMKLGAMGGAGIAALNLLPATGGSTRALAQDAEPKMGGTVSMSMADSDATSFDPPVPVDNMSIWTMLLFYDQLVRVNADGTAIEPGLAESWSGNEDATEYTFNLRDATFH
ncbi:MAG: hypothetical protein KC438_07895, partial [Thermomicrobiales bacterium]|nr:hypothetical protein [Thermomicrobiales bacterium]